MLTFLGTSGEAASPRRRAPALAVLRGKDAWLFDAGEDTQRAIATPPAAAVAAAAAAAAATASAPDKPAGGAEGEAGADADSSSAGGSGGGSGGGGGGGGGGASSNSGAHLKASKIFRVFVSSLRADRALGLPGLLCTLGAARAKGHENADIPVHVYGPPGTADFLASLYQVRTMR